MMLFEVFVLLMLPLYTNPVPIRIISFKCEPNENVCSDNFCTITLVRQRLSLINFNCNFREPQSSLMVHLQVFRKQRNQFRPWLVNFSEDICRVMGKSIHSQTFAKMLPGIRQYANVSATCPLMGNITISNYPVDYSFIPSVIPNGEYQVKTMVRNAIKNISIVVVVTDFQVAFHKKWTK